MEISDISNRKPFLLCSVCSEKAEVSISAGWVHHNISLMRLCNSCKRELIKELFVKDLIIKLEQLHENYIRSIMSDDLHGMIEGNFRGIEVREIINLIEEIL